MGRPPKQPDDWLEDNEQMLSWLEDQLRKKSALPHKPMTEPRKEYLLRALKNYLGRPDTDAREFGRLKRAWRGYKSGKKRKYATTTLRMPLSTRDKLKRIAGDSSLSEVMNELIEDVDQVRKKVRQDLEDQYQRRIQRKFPSPPQQVQNELRRTRAQLEDQKLANQHLFKEIAQYLVLLEDAGVAKTRLTAEQRARVEDKYQAMASLPEERLSEFLYPYDDES